MAISATMSVWGIYQISPTLFDGLSVPDGIDKENVKDNILLQSENLEVLYSNPDFLKAAITVWSTERLPIWEKLYATTQYEYNPIENYDRYEQGTNSASGTSSGENSTTSSGQNSTTSSGQNSTTSSGENSTTSSGENESVTSNTAYDSNTFADSTKAVSSGSNTSSSTNSNTESGTNSATESGTNSTTASSNGSNEYENSGSFTTHIHGNIGVRSSQELIEQERRIADFCITSYIVEEFIDKFCIGVY